MEETTKMYYMRFNENNPKIFFSNLRHITNIWKKDVSIYVNDNAKERLKKFAKKSTVIGEQNPIMKMTFKVNGELIDILLNEGNKVIEISFGPMSSENRIIYMPYKRKECSRKLIVY